MLFQRDAVELARDRVALSRRLGSSVAATVPPQQIRLHGVGQRRPVEVLSPRVHQPYTGTLAAGELSPEIEAVVSRFVVRALAERHLSGRSAPGLILEGRPIHADEM